MRYRKKPVVVDAIQYQPHENCREVAAFVGQPFEGCEFAPADSNWVINTLEGVMEVNPGWWIIRGIKGELYPCRPDIFEATYEPVP